MKYTIAIPTHDDFDTIERCIDSVLNVNFQDYEIVISDTSTTEETWKYLQEKVRDMKNIRVYRNDKNWDMWKNHNFCMEKSNGDYILYIHSDDVLLDDSLAIIDKYLKKLSYPEKIVMWGRSLYKDYGSILKKNGLTLEQSICGSEAISLFLAGGLTPSGTLISKSFIQIGGYLADDMIPPHSDCISMINCVFKGFKFYMYNDIIFLREVNGTVFKKIKKQEVVTMCEFLKEYFTSNQILLLIDLSFQYELFGIINFLCIDKKINKIINKKLTRRLIRRPYKLFNLRYLNFIVTKFRYLGYK